MINHNIQAILIMDKGGVPLFFIKLDPKALDIDPYLLSAFFAALDHFSGEVIELETSLFQIDYGARLFTTLTREEANLVALSVNEWHHEVNEVLDSLLDEFVDKWLEPSSGIKIQADLQSHLPEFRESVIQQLTFQHVSAKWVPRYVTTQKTDPSGWSSPLVSFIDGVIAVDKIIARSGLPGKDVLEEIGRLWTQNSIRFRNVLEGSDIVVETEKMRKVIQDSSADRVKLEADNPGFTALLPRLSSIIDGRRTIIEIAELLPNFEEEQINAVLDYFFDRGTIEILSPEKRRIQVAKSAFEIALKISEKIYSVEITRNALENVISKIAAPEVIGEIELSQNTWSINYELWLVEGLEPTRLMEIFAEWMNLMARFVTELDPKKLSKFCDALYQEYKDNLINRFYPSDLRGLEEFSFWLEMLTGNK